MDTTDITVNGPGSGNRKRCPSCHSFASRHPLGIWKKCGGGKVICVLERCDNPVEWVGYGEGNPKMGTDADPGVPCRYCHDHRYRLDPSPFRDDFNTDFNEERHGWRQEISSGNKFPVEERGF